MWVNNNNNNNLDLTTIDAIKEKPVQHLIEDTSVDTTAAPSDDDAKRLESLGYKQEFDREISLFVQAGFAFSCMGVLPNW